ncbi:MAG: cyclic nucleotide-binding domain-containing protein [Rhodospirillales bacterium]|nr:MAG: cyclic nucleotide-binding domain-containing protein [Rhodospirillales bacterium]
MATTTRSTTIVRPPGRGPSTATNLDRMALLRATEIFGGLEDRDLATLAAYSRVRRMRKGEVIYRKGDRDASMVVVLAGLVKISVPSALEREVVLNVIHDGEVFGEIALIDGRPRSADATAMTGGDLLVLDRRVVLPFLRANADVAIVCWRRCAGGSGAQASRSRTCVSSTPPAAWPRR